METLTMSRRERDRLTIMVGIKRQELTLVEAAQVMDLSYRQTRRVWRRYQTDGDAGLVHRWRGRPSLLQQRGRTVNLSATNQTNPATDSPATRRPRR
jgi:transposase